MGLSPRVRGNLRSNRVVSVRAGTIPACAGEPPRRVSRGHTIWDYPRVCGGTNDEAYYARWVEGLSPRVRGNLIDQHRKQVVRGTIPACAGEPLPIPNQRQSAGDYPRVCGGTS